MLRKSVSGFAGCCAMVVLAGLLRAAEPAAGRDEVRAAVTKSLPLIKKGAAGHLAQKDCFTCHNTGLPILALTTAKRHGFAVSDLDIQPHLEFTANFLAKNRESYLKGKGQGGQVATAGYALWTLELGGWKPDATTAAVAEYFLLFNGELSHWQTRANRPPSEVSQFMVNYLASRGLQAYGTLEQKERIGGRLDKVKGWLLQAPAKDTEDRVFRLLALKRLDSDDQELQAAARELLKTQRNDGGWSQLDSLDSDAYATGSALVSLQLAGGLGTGAPAYQKGLQFLLQTQRDDGSWLVRSRSRPFQTYYESGFPHAKDQFISIAASSWAATALALACPAARP